MLPSFARTRPAVFACALAFGLSAQGGAATAAEKHLRVAVPFADVPTTTGIPTLGYDGLRIAGLPVFEGLTQWDLRRADGEPELRPGLAESWERDASNPRRWTFRLRKNVRFHDGSAFDADAALWNLDRLLKTDAPQHDPAAAAIARGRLPTLKGMAEDRRFDHRARHRGADHPAPVRAVDHPVREPGRVRPCRNLAGIRAQALRHRPVPDHQGHAAGEPGDGSQRSVL